MRKQRDSHQKRKICLPKVLLMCNVMKKLIYLSCLVLALMSCSKSEKKAIIGNWYVTDAYVIYDNGERGEMGTDEYSWSFQKDGILLVNNSRPHRYEVESGTIRTYDIATGESWRDCTIVELTETTLKIKWLGGAVPRPYHCHYDFVKY